MEISLNLQMEEKTFQSVEFGEAKIASVYTLALLAVMYSQENRLIR